MDGGIDKVKAKVESYFIESFAKQQQGTCEQPQPLKRVEVGLEHLRVGILCPPSSSSSSSTPYIPRNVAKAFVDITNAIVSKGGVVAVPQNNPLLACPAYLNEV